MMRTELAQSESCPELSQLIASRIASHPDKRVTFAAFMAWALYEPKLGYYSAQRQKIGAGGDFVTSPHLGADFGELLAEQFLDLWLSLNRPTSFQIVEMGAGQGLIAGDVLRYLCDRPIYADFWQALDYIIIEKADALIAEQQHTLQPFAQAHKLTWKTWQDIPDDSVIGCFFSNELVDAFPVHRFEIQSGQLQELYVSLSDTDPPQWIDLAAEPSTPALQTHLEDLGLNLESFPDGYRSEINLAALDWLKIVDQKLHQGYVLTIDYGHTATQYYSLQRSQGTLQCYSQQSHHNDPYWAIARQDITAHVNFTALQKHGQTCGLENIGFTQQGLFLMGLGLGDRLNANTASTHLDFLEILRRRDAIHSLINPLGLGGFGVLLQLKNGTSAIPNYAFKGFAMDL
jgi:SAM-dependent MidA family methyltransferase